MTDKTMPERIGAYRYDKTLKHAGSTANGTWADARNHMYREGAWAHAEYIRADLVPAPSADDPLEAGQYRWVKIDIESPWRPLNVTALLSYDGTPGFALGGNRRRPEDFYKIGPVANPPED